MRTFPKSLATFRKIVDERGEGLRKLTQDELKKLAAEPTEHLIVESRPATIGIIVEPKPSGVSAKPAMRGHFKTGHVRWPGT
jgi:hypothetical protein